MSSETPAQAAKARAARLLALSTSGTWCSVALYRRDDDDDESECVSEPLGSDQSMHILRMIDEMCSGARIELDELDAIAFDAGPGSFTGLRIGCAVAQGLGFALDIPLVAVDSLRALAWQRVRVAPCVEATVLVANDARMDELYVALYHLPATAAGAAQIDGASAAARLETIEAPHLVRRDAFAEVVAARIAEGRVPDADTLLRAGDAWLQTPLANEWKSRFGSAMPAPPAADDAYVRADALAELGCADWLAGVAIAASNAAPRYLRDKVALDRDEQRALRERRDATR